MTNTLNVLVLAAILFGSAQSVAGQDPSKIEVLTALSQRDKAFVAGDEAKVAAFMAEDYLQTDVRGRVQDKQHWLAEYYRPMAPLLKSGKTRWTTFDRTDVVVRDLGDAVVLAGEGRLKLMGVNPDNPNATFSPGPPRIYRFTHVWVKRAGSWKLAVVHNAFPEERK
jgi:ketosteroid isomerase-like protein